MRVGQCLGQRGVRAERDRRVQLVEVDLLDAHALNGGLGGVGERTT